MRDIDIAEVAEQSGVRASTLRFYEEKGLIASHGRRGLRRLFDPGVLDRLALIALGYRSLSLSATALGPVKAMVIDLDAKKAEAMLGPLLDAPAGSVSIRQKLTEFAEAEGLAL